MCEGGGGGRARGGVRGGIDLESDSELLTVLRHREKRYNLVGCIFVMVWKLRWEFGPKSRFELISSKSNGKLKWKISLQNDNQRFRWLHLKIKLSWQDNTLARGYLNLSPLCSNSKVHLICSGSFIKRYKISCYTGRNRCWWRHQFLQVMYRRHTRYSVITTSETDM